MISPPPSPTDAAADRTAVFLGYLDYFRSQVIATVHGLPAEALRTSRLASGWTPLELVKHLTFVELRWIVWGFQGGDVAEPWGDRRDDRWYVGPDETLDELVAALSRQGIVTSNAVTSADLAAIGQPGPRWEGEDPPSLERILFHLVQEYARHLGHLDIVAEFISGTTE